MRHKVPQREGKLMAEDTPSFEEDVTTILSHVLQPSTEETTNAANAALARLQAEYTAKDDVE